LGGEVVVLEAVAVALEAEDLGVVDGPVDHRDGDDVVAEDLSPGRERLVRGDDHRGLLLAGGDEHEHEVGGLGVERYIADRASYPNIQPRIKRRRIAAHMAPHPAMARGQGPSALAWLRKQASSCPSRTLGAEAGRSTCEILIRVMPEESATPDLVEARALAFENMAHTTPASMCSLASVRPKRIFTYP